MAIQADYHLHSSFSGDSEAPMETMIPLISSSALPICARERIPISLISGKEEARKRRSANIFLPL